MIKLQFIVDENLPPHLAFWLRDQGHAADHVSYIGLESTPDRDIWTWAAERNAIVVSKDQDFRNRVTPGVAPQLLWIRWGNSRKRELIHKLTPLWPDISRAFINGECLFELTDRIP